jgi:predicted TIM-barrel fold metal-dependent hydrolase
MPPGSVIDIHVHLAGDNGPSGAYISAAMKAKPAFGWMLLATGQVLKKVNDATIVDHLLNVVRASARVDKVVFLAMDAAYNAEGQRLKSHLYTPNAWAADVAAQNPEKVLFGASVHPDSPDWESRLDFALEHKAALLKWVPSSQAIDPLCPRYAAFYRKLADNKLPLLCHTGPEHAIPDAGGLRPAYARSLNHPLRLMAPLREGVTVIAAHCCTPLLPLEPNYFEEFVSMMTWAAAAGWPFYADVSALALVPQGIRSLYLRRIANELPPERLILGSDYPIPVGGPAIDLGHPASIAEWFKAERNPLDRNVEAVQEMGLDSQVLTNASRVLRLRS